MSTRGKTPEIQWEEDDDSFGVNPEERRDDGDFASLLAGTSDEEPELIVGEKIRGVVSSIPREGGDVLVDLGGKLSGIIDKAEVADENGVVSLKVGDAIEPFVLSRKGDEILLSLRLSQQLKSMEDLEGAYAKRLPVRGRVTKLNKGGFEVTILGKTAFCPISQIDNRFVDQGAEYVGKDLEFLIEKFDPRGRNIVVTRKALLAQQAEQRAKELMASLKPDTVLDGTVRELRDFGAFVDIGGVDGLVHVSELAHARVQRPADVVAVGDKVKVKVLKVEEDPKAKGRPKISLSMKAASQDPWETIEREIETGKTYTGRVVKLMPFGAFVEVKPGFEGLVHVSEMSWTKRVHHPSDVVKEGDVVSVVVKDIDRTQKRIALSIKQAEADPWLEVTGRYGPGHVVAAKVERLKPFGAIVELADGVTGLVPVTTLKRKFGEAYRQAATPGKEIEVRVANVDALERKILLSLTDIDDGDDDDKNYREYVEAERIARAAEVEAASRAVATGRDDKMGSFGALLGAKLNEKRR